MDRLIAARLVIAGVLLAGCGGAEVSPTPTTSARPPGTTAPAHTATTPGTAASAPASPAGPVSPAGAPAFRQVIDFPAGDAFEVTGVTATPTGYFAVGFAPMPGEGYFDRRRGVTWSSSDGASWAQQAPDPGLEMVTPWHVAWLGGSLYMLGVVATCPLIIDDGCVEPPDSGNFAWRSADGATWERLPAAPSLQRGEIYGAAVVGERLFVFGGAGDELVTTIWSSADVTTWNETTDLAGLDPVSAVGAAPSTDVLAFGTQLVEDAESVRLVAAASADGAHFEPLPMPDVDNASVEDVASTDSTVVAVGNGSTETLALSGLALYSSDGVSWAQADDVDGTFEGAALEDVYAVGAGFVALGYGPREDDPELWVGRVWSSPDGESWEQVATLECSLTQLSASALGASGLVVFTADQEEFDDGTVESTIAAWFAPLDGLAAR